MKELPFNEQANFAEAGFTDGLTTDPMHKFSCSVKPSEDFAYFKMTQRSEAMWQVPDGEVVRFTATFELDRVPVADTGFLVLEAKTIKPFGVHMVLGLPFELAIRDGKFVARTNEYSMGHGKTVETPVFTIGEEEALAAVKGKFRVIVELTPNDQFIRITLRVTNLESRYSVMKTWPALNRRSYKGMFFAFAVGLWFDNVEPGMLELSEDSQKAVELSVTDMSCYQGTSAEFDAEDEARNQAAYVADCAAERANDAQNAAQSAPAASKKAQRNSKKHD